MKGVCPRWKYLVISTMHMNKHVDGNVKAS